MVSRGVDTFLELTDVPSDKQLELAQLHEVKAATLAQLSQALDEGGELASIVRDRFVRGLHLLTRDADTFRNLRLAVCPLRDIAVVSAKRRLQSEIWLTMTALHILKTNRLDESQVHLANPSSASLASATKRF